jgi:hypothetical protein
MPACLARLRTHCRRFRILGGRCRIGGGNGGASQRQRGGHSGTFGGKRKTVVGFHEDSLVLLVRSPQYAGLVISGMFHAEV